MNGLIKLKSAFRNTFGYKLKAGIKAFLMAFSDRKYIVLEVEEVGQDYDITATFHNIPERMFLSLMAEIGQDAKRMKEVEDELHALTETYKSRN